jgi:hypothetical protein
MGEFAELSPEIFQSAQAILMRSIAPVRFFIFFLARIFQPINANQLRFHDPK